VLAGGRYDGLVEFMGGDKVKAIGFAAGIERLAELVSSHNQLDSKRKVIPLIIIGEEAEKQALKLSHDLRKANIAIDCDFGKNIAKQFKRANDIGASKVIIVGEDEIREGKFKLKDMESGLEEKYEYASLIDAIKK
jgi:histidyl-tRNA synthetase